MNAYRQPEAWRIVTDVVGGPADDYRQQIALIEKMTAQLQRLKLARLVKACTRLKGKKAPLPFELNLDFVSRPPDRPDQLSKTHLVLGVEYLDPARLGDLRSLLKLKILELV